jgi:hypothetical protein
MIFLYMLLILAYETEQARTVIDTFRQTRAEFSDLMENIKKSEYLVTMDVVSLYAEAVATLFRLIDQAKELKEIPDDVLFILKEKKQRYGKELKAWKKELNLKLNELLQSVRSRAVNGIPL